MKTYSETYEGGLPEIRGPKSLKLTFSPGKLSLKISSLFYSKEVSFSPTDILEVDLNQESYRSLTGGLVGATLGNAVIGGSSGAAAGAIIGGRRYRENHLHLKVKYEDVDFKIFLKPKADLALLYSDLKLFMNGQDVGTKAPGRAEPYKTVMSPDGIETRML